MLTVTKTFSILLLSTYSLLLTAEINSASAIGKVYAAGLTYKKHIQDSGESVDQEKGPPIFLKAPRTTLFAEILKRVAIPKDAIVYAELDKLEAGLSEKVQDKYENGFPHLMDYEGEIGLYFTRDVQKSELSASTLNNAVSLFAANDLSLRSIQILGDKRDNVYEYWSVAKSFEGFLPHSYPVAVASFPLQKWIDLTVRLWVNGEIRQNESTTDIAYTPKKMIETLMKHTGSTIPKGTALILGTPTGTAFKISWFKRLMGNLLFFARMLKFKIAVDGMLDDPNFLKAGDEVIVEVPGVGQNRVKIVD